MEPIEHLMLASLVLTRLISMLLTAPLLGSQHVPIRFRILLGVVLTVLTLPLLSAHQPAVPAVSSWIPGLLAEVTIGISLGLGVAIVYSAAQMAGSVIAQMAALPMGDLDAGGHTHSPVGHLFGVLSAAVFALMNGPELLITSTIDTFFYLPAGISLQTQPLTQLVVELCRQSFLLTLRGVTPAIAAMLISTVSIGILNRAYPQFNLMSLGISANVLVMLLALMFTIGGSVWLFVDDFEQLLDGIGLGLSQAMETDSQ